VALIKSIIQGSEPQTAADFMRDIAVYPDDLCNILAGNGKGSLEDWSVDPDAAQEPQLNVGVLTQDR
jgi:hypothetical protein